MQRKIILVAVILLLGLAGTILVLEIIPSDPPVQKGTEPEIKPSKITPQVKETTIRNVTEDSLIYYIKPHDSEQEPEKKILAVGGIDRYPGNMSVDITFEREGKKITYTIDPGLPYSFRPNEDEELELYDGSHGKADAEDLAPFVPTPMPVVEKMLELAEIKKDDIVYDLGCGDGRIVITAAKQYGIKGIGIDIIQDRIQESREGAKKAGVTELVEFRLQDATKVNFSEASVVTLYLLPESNELLRPLLDQQLKPGSRVVSHGYRIPGWEEKLAESVTVEDEYGDIHSVFLYRK